MSKVWFTSDTHFGHKNIVRACSVWDDVESTRDFASIQEHDDYLLNEINRRVKSTDTLYHLGDFGFGYGDRERFKELRARIKCERIHLLIGNHDRAFEDDDSELRSIFISVRRLRYGKIAGRKMTLCHYAMRTFPWQHRQGIHLHGHSHGNLLDLKESLTLDVGVDTCLYGHERYTPYSAEEVFSIMDQFKRFSPVDHHE